MEWVNLIISLLSGLLGGNIAGATLKDKNLGALGNSISGLIGGGLGGYILQMLGLFGVTAATGTPEAAPDLAHLDLTQIIGNIAGSGVGGAILTMIVTYIKNAMNKG